MDFGYLNRGIARLVIAAVLATYCGLPQLAHAQTQASQSPDTQQPNAVQGADRAPSPSGSAPSSTQAPSQPASQSAPGGIVDPSAGPLEPIPSEQQQLPNAPSTARQSESTQTTPEQNESIQQPVGAAGAQVGPTAGGAASKPAGNAIAPAKQRQTRSFLIKMGAVAAAAVAIGTVVALSRGTKGNPPGAR